MSLLIIVPIAVSRHKRFIQIKIGVVSIMLTLSFAAIVLKSLVMIDINGKPILTFDDLSKSSKKFWGLEKDQSVFIVINDAI